jgi:hypothetical protein
MAGIFRILSYAVDSVGHAGVPTLLNSLDRGFAL